MCPLLAPCRIQPAGPHRTVFNHWQLRTLDLVVDDVQNRRSGRVGDGVASRSSSAGAPRRLGTLLPTRAAGSVDANRNTTLDVQLGFGCREELKEGEGG